MIFSGFFLLLKLRPFYQGHYTMTMLKLSDIEKVTGGVLDDDYIDYLTRVMFYAKRADKTLDQVLSDLRDRGCTQEALDYVVAHW